MGCGLRITGYGFGAGSKQLQIQEYAQFAGAIDPAAQYRGELPSRIVEQKGATPPPYGSSRGTEIIIIPLLKASIIDGERLDH